MDVAVLSFFNNTISTPLLDRFFVYICNFSIWVWPLAVVMVALLWKGGPRARWMILLAVVAIAIIDPAIYRILKPLFGRLRPCHEIALEWIRAVDGCGGRYGFPSSHAANTFGMAVVVGAFYKRTRYYLYPLAVLVSIGRMYLGVHYPSDVIAGAIFGAAVGFGIIYIAGIAFPDSAGKMLKYRRVKNEKEDN